MQIQISFVEKPPSRSIVCSSGLDVNSLQLLVKVASRWRSSYSDKSKTNLRCVQEAASKRVDLPEDKPYMMRRTIYFCLGDYPECMGVTLTIGPEAHVSSINVHAEMYALAGKYDIKRPEEYFGTTNLELLRKARLPDPSSALVLDIGGHRYCLLCRSSQF